MSNICDIYTKAVYTNLRPLFANWEPGKPIKLGDYGLLKKKSFNYLGNINQFGITFKIRKDKTHNNQRFTAGNNTDFKIIPKGEISPAGIQCILASLEVDFKSENGVFFNAAGCEHNLIENKSDVEKKILRLYEEKKWKKRWVVITELVKSKSATILISGNKTSSILLEASESIQNIDLADGSLKLETKLTNNIGYSLITKDSLIPLMSLSRIQDKLFEKPVVEPVYDMILRPSPPRPPRSQEYRMTEKKLVFDQIK
jgi:hypothetical protein